MSLKADIDKQIELTTIEPDQDTKDVFKYAISKGGAGIPHDNQMLSTWWYGGPDVTYLMDWIYFLVELAKDGENYSMQDLHKMARYWFIQPSHFGDYCGLYKQYGFTKRIDDILDTLDRQAFIEVLSAFRSYIMNINAWIFQYWPWGVSHAFPRKDKKYFQKAIELCDE